MCKKNRNFVPFFELKRMEDSNKALFSILNERLELLRQLDKEGDSDRRRHIAQETQTLHAPMAHRLGLYQIKTEMEDLALKFLDYDTYKYIAHALNAKKAEREAYIASFIAPLEQKLKAEGKLEDQEESDEINACSIVVPVDEDGFFRSLDNISGVTRTDRKGLFLAGTCTGPKTIPETLAEARSAALQVYQYLKAKKK